MTHDAQVTITNANVQFKNSSRDGFANGVIISDDGHKATIWIDDTDADVAVTGSSKDGEVMVGIGTNGEYGYGPYVTIGGSAASGTEVTEIEGIVSVVIV